MPAGPSGSGKSTLAREAFPESLVAGYDWPEDKAVVDGFPAELSIKDVTAALSSVGFSTPPAWLRPFRWDQLSSADKAVAWSEWRRSHQCRARRSHYKKRKAKPPDD